MRALSAFVLLLTPSFAAADVLHMADGTTREGRVVETTEKEVVVDFGQGSVSMTVRLPRASVLRIEPKASPADALSAEYARQFAKAAQGNADDWYALGVWCLAQRCLNDKARQAFERAITLDPNHADAHAALGHVKLNDAWMPRDRAIRLLAPDQAAADEDAKARELAVLRQLEDATTELLQARKRIEELDAKVGEVAKENEQYRQRLALPAMPPDYLRPRIIYRPIFIIPPRPFGPPRDDPKTPTPHSPKDIDPKVHKTPADSDPKTPPTDPKPPKTDSPKGGSL
jgi:hypothetical protein